MAKSPMGLISGVLNSMRGQIVPKDTPEPTAIKQARMQVLETTSDTIRKGRLIAQGTTSSRRSQNLLGSSALGNQIFISTAQRKQENRDIMDMFPDLERNARYLIASYFSPVDLNITTIPIAIKTDGISPNKETALQSKLTAVLDEKLDLSGELPDITYNMGFISGGELMITVPMRSMQESFNSILSTEQLKEKLDNISPGPFKNTNDAIDTSTGMSMESLVEKFPSFRADADPFQKKMGSASSVATWLNGAISSESLKLSGNLQLLSEKERIDRSNNKLRNAQAMGKTPEEDFKNLRVKSRPETTAILHAPTPEEGEPVAISDPVVMRVSAESAFFIFPPNAPDRPIAAVLMLDETGAPLTIGAMGGFSQVSANIVSGANSSSMFQDVGRAMGNCSNTDLMQVEGQRQLQDLYRSFMSSYITKKVEEAGYGSIKIGDTESVMRSLFYRYMEKKCTRMLIIPKDYFTYFTFSVGPDGIGRTKIEGIKQYLVMKMAVLISRVLASMRAAADTRSISVTVDTASVVPEDTIVQSVLDSYCEKSLLDLNSLNMNSIQSRIITSALTVNVKNTSGAQEGAYTVTNDPITQGKPVDFDPEITTYLDSQINSKVPVPASLTSSLDEPELATTITTANLFYSMLVSLDQRRIAKLATRWIRQFCRHSQDIRDLISKVLEEKDQKAPSGDKGSLGDTTDNTSRGVTVDDVIDSLHVVLPKPIISKSNAQFSNIGNMVDAVDKIVQAMFPDSLADGDDASKALAALRTTMIRNVVAGMASEAGMTQLNVGELGITNALNSTLDLRDRLNNAAKALKTQTDLTAAPPADGTTPAADTSGDGGYDGSGGYV